MSRVFVREQDVLRVISIASVTSPISIHADVLTQHGRLIPINFAQSPNTDRTALGTDSPAIGAQGEIVSATVQSRTTGVKRGQCYATLNVRGGETYTGVCKGYVYEGHQVDLGQFVEPGPGGGEGWLRVVTGTDPAAQTSPSDAVPTNAMWRLDAYQVQLVSIAGDTAAPRLFVETPTRIRKWMGGLQDAVAGAETQTYVWTRGNGTIPDATPTPFTDTEAISIRGEIPDRLYMVEGDIVRILTTGTFGATSNYGAPSITVEEWLVI